MKSTLIQRGGNFANPVNSVIVLRAEIITGHAVQQSRISVHIFFSSLSSLFYSCDNLWHSTVQRLVCPCIYIGITSVNHACYLKLWVAALKRMDTWILGCYMNQAKPDRVFGTQENIFHFIVMFSVDPKFTSYPKFISCLQCCTSSFNLRFIWYKYLCQPNQRFQEYWLFHQG